MKQQKKWLPVHSPFSTLFAIRLVILLLLITVISGQATSGEAYGPITHHNILWRAFNNLDAESYQGLVALLQERPFEANWGSTFPDWGYAVGNAFAEGSPQKAYYADLAEIAHHQEFVDLMLEYLKPSFGSSDPEDRRAIAFVLGVIAHNEGDNVSHFGEGNIISAAAQNGIDHTTFEWDSELYVREMWEGGYMNYHSCNEWWFPNKGKLAALYAYANLNHPEVEEVQMMRGYDLITAACRLVITQPYLFLPDWLENNLESYRPGGLSDGGEHTAAVMQTTWTVIQTKPRMYLPGVFWQK